MSKQQILNELNKTEHLIKVFSEIDCEAVKHYELRLKELNNKMLDIMTNEFNENITLISEALND